MKRVLLPLALAVVVGCESAPAPTPSSGQSPPTEQQSRRDDYSSWPSVTDEPYLIDYVRVFPCSYGVVIPRREDQVKEHGPHTDYAINVRVNPTGHEAFLARTPLPVGTVVVKEKLKDGKVVAIGTMTKREPGYDPEYADWEYGYRELKADAPPPATGKLDTCIACHRTAANKDYLFRPYLPHAAK